MTGPVLVDPAPQVDVFRESFWGLNDAGAVTPYFSGWVRLDDEPDRWPLGPTTDKAEREAEIHRHLAARGLVIDQP